MKFWALVFLFLLGVGLGIAGPIFGPKYFGDYIPEFIQKEGENVEGEVVRKQKEGKKLLMTVSTDQGAILATFNQKVAEINLLVEEGDSVTFRLRGYDPFVTNPPVVKVKKEPGTPNNRPTHSEFQNQSEKQNKSKHPQKPDLPEKSPASTETEAPMSPLSEKEGP